MSSESDYRSSSSPARDKPPKDKPERSRSRDKDYRRRPQSNPSEKGKTKIRIPELTSNLLTFRDFLRNQIQRINIEQAQKAYDKYKKDWEEKQNELFVNTYRDDAWFRQKYDPQFLDAIENERKQNVKKNFAQFMTNFSANAYMNIDLGIKDAMSLGYTLPTDRLEQQDDSLNILNAQTIDIGLNQEIKISGEPYFGFDPDENTLFAKNIPKTISRFDIYAVVKQLKGFKNITISEPAKKSNFLRLCWIEFLDEESLLQANLSMSGIMIKDEKIGFTKSVSRLKKVKVLKNYPTSRISNDLETALNMMKKLDKQCQIQNNLLLESSFESDKKKFDIILLYLRRVHAYDYFTTLSFENQRMLSLRLGAAYLRLEVNYNEIQNFQTVFKRIKQSNEKKLKEQNLIPDYLGNLRLQIQKYIRQTEKISKQQVKQIWKCSICEKKFKTCEFLAKHIMMKHPEIKDKKVKFMMDQAYMRDPNKITNITIRQRSQKHFRGRPKPYKDLDEPQGQKTIKTINKPMVNYLDI